MPAPVAWRRHAGYSGNDIPPIVPPAGIPYDWWDPDLNAYSDLGTTLQTANNGPIQQINTQTLTGNNITNSGSSVRPLLQTGAINGHSGVLFNGSSQYLTKVFASDLGTDYTFVMAVNLVSWTLYDCLWGDTTNGQPTLIMNSSSPEVQFITADIGSGAPQVSPTIGSWVILSWQRELASPYNKSMQLNLNGAVTDQGQDFDLAGVVFGGRAGPSAYSNIEIGRVALYNSLLGSSAWAAAIQSFGTYYALF
jgi:hypothetical protein